MREFRCLPPEMQAIIDNGRRTQKSPNEMFSDLQAHCDDWNRRQPSIRNMIRKLAGIEPVEDD